MKYLVAILLFILSIFFTGVLSFNNSGWQMLQPFLISTLLVYFNTKNQWLYYGYALLAGLYVDSLTGVFGLHAAIFISIIFLLFILQATILTSKNILAIIILSAFSLVFYWLVFWLFSLIFDLGLYIFHKPLFIFMMRTFFVNILIVIFLHLLYYNLWQKKRDYGEKQSF